MRASLLAALAYGTCAHAATLWLTLPTNPAPCSFDAVAAALKARRPGTEVRPGKGEPQIGLARSGNGFSLEVSAPEQPPLERQLPPPAADCVDLAETTALMVDRYLESVSWKGTDVTVGRVPPPPPPRPFVELGAGASETLTGTVPALLLELGARKGRWQVALGAAGQLEATTPVTASDGTTAALNLGTLGTQALLGRRFDLGPGDLGLEVGPAAELYWVSATGTAKLYHQQTALAALPAVAVRLGYELALSAHFWLWLRVEARAHLGQQTFYLQGYTPQLFTRWVDGDTAAGVGFAL